MTVWRKGGSVRTREEERRRRRRGEETEQTVLNGEMNADEPVHQVKSQKDRREEDLIKDMGRQQPKK